MDKLLACEPHYIRCIKSNDDKRSGYIDEQRVRHQVRYLGLLENVRVRRAGFAYRQTYDRFIWRYKMLSKETWPRWNKSSQAGTQQILNSLGIGAEEYRMGKTKVFIRNPTTLFKLEELREREMPRIVTLMQAAWRGYCARSKWAKRKAAINIQLFYRKYRVRYNFVLIDTR
jgi:myosin-1